MAYSTIKDPSAHFQTVLWTGNNADTHAITNDGNSDLQPDWVWIKRRDYDNQPVLHDSSRGVTKFISTDRTDAEGTISPTTKFQSFDSNGFTTGSVSGAYNASGEPFVAWQWKANGGTTTSVSASGTGSGCVNACTHQANTTAGFSIITYTGRDDQLNNGQESKLTHGLGVAPKVFICKRRDSADDWFYMGGDQASVRQGWYNGFLSLNDTDAVNGNHYVSNTQPDSTYIYLGNEKVNIASEAYIGYAFAEIQGYSKFGKYTGNGQTSGPFVHTGFKPAFVLLKRTNTTSNWIIMDNKRDTFNEMETRLFPNLPNAEQSQSSYGLDFLSNGFKLRDTVSQSNGSGSTYIYMAFAESPFVAGGIPTNAK